MHKLLTIGAAVVGLAVFCVAVVVTALPTSAEADNKNSAIAVDEIGRLTADSGFGTTRTDHGAPGAYERYGTYYAPPLAYYGPGSPGCYWHWRRVWDGNMWRQQHVYMCY
jgi:hypothetical protein